MAFALEYGMEDNTKILLQKYIDKFYDQFLSVVAKGRNMSKDDVHKIAQGRIWLGSTAKDIGLVDVLGNLDTAIEICAKKANLKEYSLTKYPRVKQNIFKEIMTEISNQSKIDSKLMNSKYYRQLKPMLDVISDESRIAEPQAKMPYMIEFR